MTKTKVMLCLEDLGMLFIVCFEDEIKYPFVLEKKDFQTISLPTDESLSKAMRR